LHAKLDANSSICMHGNIQVYMNVKLDPNYLVHLHANLYAYISIHLHAYI